MENLFWNAHFQIWCQFRCICICDYIFNFSYFQNYWVYSLSILNNTVLQTEYLWHTWHTLYIFSFIFSTYYFTIVCTPKFISCNNKFFTSLNYLRFLYFALMWSILKFSVVVWQSYLAKYQLKLECVQNQLLSFAAFTLKFMYLSMIIINCIICLKFLPLLHVTLLWIRKKAI